MPTMGSKLKLEIMTREAKGATYRYSGRIMGLTIDFSETMTTPDGKGIWRVLC